MTKKKNIGENITPPKWNKIILVETGQNYISREDFLSMRSYNMPYRDAEVEQHIFETTDENLIKIIQTMMEKDNEIKRLKGVINGYQEATDKIMKEVK